MIKGIIKTTLKPRLRTLITKLRSSSQPQHASISSNIPKQPTAYLHRKNHPKSRAGVIVLPRARRRRAYHGTLLRMKNNSCARETQIYQGSCLVVRACCSPSTCVPFLSACRSNWFVFAKQLRCAAISAWMICLLILFLFYCCIMKRFFFIGRWYKLSLRSL